MAGVEVTENDLKLILKNLKVENQRIKIFQLIPICDYLGLWGDYFILKIFIDLEICEVFVKAVPRHIEKRLELINETKFFEKETKFYEHFAPLLSKFSTISWSPQCYLAKSGHFIVFENLKSHKTFSSPNFTLDYNHYAVAAKTLGIFHASSVIHEEKCGRFTIEELKMLEEVSYPQHEQRVRRIGLESGIKSLLKLVERIPKNQSSKRLHEIRKKFPEIIRRIVTFVETSRKYKNVLLHGDLWVNNVMFKYNDENIPIECKFVDFQFFRYAPPAMDLATFFYASSTCEFRKNYFDKILDIYLNSFESELSYQNVNLNVLPRDEILKSFSEYRLAGMIEAALFCQTSMLSSDTATEVLNSSVEYEKFITQSRAEKCIHEFMTNTHYCDRMTEILNEIIDTFILL